MIRRWLFIAFFAGLLAVAAQFLTSSPVLAASKPVPPPPQTEIAFYPSGSIYENKPFTVTGVLRQKNGSGISDSHIDFWIDNTYIGQASTGSGGYFRFAVNRQYPVGTYLLTASFKGDHYFAGTETSLYIQVQVATAISIQDPGGVGLADVFYLVGSLTDLSTGLGVPGQIVSFDLNGIHVGQSTTNASGIFRLKVTRPLDAGSYLFHASFNGAHQLAAANGSVMVTIMPSTVKVQTIPPLPGITFQMDNRQFVSGADGTATIQVGKIGLYRLDVLLDLYHNPSKEVFFGRWTEESYLPYREVAVPTSDVIQVGLNVFHQVSLTFVDLDNFPVDPNRISSITIKSAQGDVFILKDGQPVWLPASRTARRITGLEETDLLYSVMSVVVDGSNVVNSAQQRFFALPDANWQVSLLLYTLKINAVDGLFGSPVAKSVDVQYPDGQVKNFPLDGSGNMTLHSLARGIYRVELVGAKGMKNIIPVALSRNQEVNEKVITYLDLGVLSAIGLLTVLGLIFYGRPWLLRHLFTRRRPAAKEAGWSSIHEN